MKGKAAQRYEMFAREYVIDLNGTRAAIAAGYSENGAEVRGSELLRKRKVQKLIEQLQSARAAKAEMSALQIDQALEGLVRANMKDYGNPSDLDMDSITREQAAAIQEWTEDTTGGAGDGERKLVLRTRLKLADKLRAIDLLYRRRGLITDKSSMHVTGLEGLAERLNKIRDRKNVSSGA